MTIDIKTPIAFKELWQPKRYKVYHGGRGGGKSWAFAAVLLVMAMQKKMRILCTREIQNSIKDSVHRVLTDVIEEFKIPDYVYTRDAITNSRTGSEFIFKGLKSNTQAIKSTEGVDICWVEEAQSVSEESLDVLIPTIRRSGSEIWFSFNRYLEADPVYSMFCLQPDDNTIVRKVLFSDNPYCTTELLDLAAKTKKLDPDKYKHVWLGEPVSALEGAYYTNQFRYIDDNQQIMDVAPDPNLLVDTWWDLGMNDATVIWFTQTEPSGFIRVLECIGGSGEGLQYWIGELQKRKAIYTYGSHNAPHDIQVRELGTGRSRLEVAYDMGLHLNVVPNIGVQDGIQAVRTILPFCYFDAEKCERGLKALRQYRKEWDDKLQSYKSRPLHDWASDYADAFRYFAVGHAKEKPVWQKNEDIYADMRYSYNDDSRDDLSGY